MDDPSRIKEHLIVYARGTGTMEGAPGVQIGIVDHVESGRFIKLTKDDSHDGRYHWFPIDWVERMDDEAIYINKNAEEVMPQLMDHQPA